MFIIKTLIANTILAVILVAIAFIIQPDLADYLPTSFGQKFGIIAGLIFVYDLALNACALVTLPLIRIIKIEFKKSSAQ